MTCFRPPTLGDVGPPMFPGLVRPRVTAHPIISIVATNAAEVKLLLWRGCRDHKFHYIKVAGLRRYEVI
jgi:hypothetical protein